MISYTTDEDYRQFSVRSAELELVFSKEDGSLHTLRRPAGTNWLGYGASRPMVDLSVGRDRIWLGEKLLVRYLHHHIDSRDDALEIVVVLGIGPLMVYDRYRLTGTLIARRITIENVSDDEIQLHSARLMLPWARIGDPELCRFEAPGNSVRPHLGLAVAAAQRRDVLPRRFFAPGLRDGRAFELAGTHAPGLLGLHEAQAGETLLCWYASDTEPAQPSVEGNDTAVTLIHELDLADWLRTGVALSGGTQYILLTHELWPAALSAFRQTLSVTGARPPIRPLDWVRDAAIYEVHPATFGGFIGLASQLRRLRLTGINTLCLLPIWAFDNRSGQLWDGNWRDSGDPYAVADFELLDPTLGSAEDLRVLVANAHRHGMRVLLDLPLTGVAAGSRYLHEQPDWFCQDEGGAPLSIGGICQFDWASNSLHTYMLGQARSWLREYELDGIRAVVPRRATPNWARRRSYHASAGSLGVLRMLEALRSELHQLRPEAVVCASLGGPLYSALADLTWDELPHHMFFHMALNRVTPAELGEWLADHRNAMLPGAVRACFVESYQTRLLNPLADGMRGSRLSQMLLAGMVLCGFVPILHGSGDEADAFVGQLLRTRAAHPALRHGATSYNTVSSDSTQLLTVVRTTADELIIGVLNTGAHKHTATLALPVARLGLDAAAYELRNLLDESSPPNVYATADLAAVKLTCLPYGVYYLLVRAVAAPAAAALAVPALEVVELV